jgi:hypothetical protein
VNSGGLGNPNKKPGKEIQTKTIFDESGKSKQKRKEIFVWLS